MYKKKHKKIAKRNYVLIAVLILALVLGLITNIVKTDRQLTFVEKAIKDSVLYVEKIFKKPITYFQEKSIQRKEKQKMYEEYKSLKEQIDSLDSLKAQNEELIKQLDDLKKQLEIDDTLVDSKYLTATVINRQLDYWNETITIDKGTNNGITNNMPVIVNQGLIGKVVNTSMFTSTVRLLTTEDPADKISIKINLDDGFVYGLLSGYNTKNKTYLIEGIGSSTVIPTDSVVTTTGMGDIFPSGILIGKVVGVTSDSFDLAKIVEVKSEIDFDDLTYVTILKRNVQ